MKEYITTNKQYIIKFFKKQYHQTINIISIGDYIQVYNTEDRFFRFSIIIYDDIDKCFGTGSEYSGYPRYLITLKELYRISKIKEILC